MKPEVIMPQTPRLNLFVRGMECGVGIIIAIVLSAMLFGCAITELDETIDEAVEQCEEIAARERAAALAQCAELLDDQIDALREDTDRRIEDILGALGCEQIDDDWDCSGICE